MNYLRSLHHLLLLSIIFSGINLSGCDISLNDEKNDDGTYGLKPAYTETKKFEKISITIELNHSHPLLAEYQKIIKFSKSGVISKEIFRDPGGFSTFYVFRDKRHLTIIDGLGEGIEIKIKNLSYRRVNNNRLLRKINIASIGRFMFISEGNYQYKYVSTDNLTKD